MKFSFRNPRQVTCEILSVLGDPLPTPSPQVKLYKCQVAIGSDPIETVYIACEVPVRTGKNATFFTGQIITEKTPPEGNEMLFTSAVKGMFSSPAATTTGSASAPAAAPAKEERTVKVKVLSVEKFMENGSRKTYTPQGGTITYTWVVGIDEAGTKIMGAMNTRDEEKAPVTVGEEIELTISKNKGFTTFKKPQTGNYRGGGGGSVSIDMKSVAWSNVFAAAYTEMMGKPGADRRASFNTACEMADEAMTRMKA